MLSAIFKFPCQAYPDAANRSGNESVRPASRAFTLIELLTVIAIIGILAAITFGLVKGVNERAAISQAKVELSTLSQALEAYKRQYGDYPQTGSYDGADTVPADVKDSSKYLFNALLGRLGPTDMGTALQPKSKSFVSVDSFSLNVDMKASDDSGIIDNAFIDPWGNQYIYYYRSNTTQQWPSYILLSAGPNGKLGITVTNGKITESNATNAADNIYANK